jgi:2-polyprenyl-3-methyl-5-hydroxy-6-metoxy-1,4-benzoquinol methylase
MDNAKTEHAYWDDIHAASHIRMRLPSRLDVSVLNFTRLMARFVRPGMRVLEIGFAPGKYLSWVGKRLGARVAGLDYSPSGIATAKKLFDAVGVEADLRCEDLFETTFEPGSFDLVYSLGVIEHFDDPRDIVSRHVSLVRPNGGMALVAIPNFGGIYGRIQRSFDPESLLIHNLDIMSVEALRRVGEADDRVAVDVFPFGRLAPSFVSWSRRLPFRAAQAAMIALNGVGLIQPADIRAVCPWLVMTMTRR